MVGYAQQGLGHNFPPAVSSPISPSVPSFPAQRCPHCSPRPRPAPRGAVQTQQRWHPRHAPKHAPPVPSPVHARSSQHGARKLRPEGSSAAPARRDGPPSSPATPVPPAQVPPLQHPRPAYLHLILAGDLLRSEMASPPAPTPSAKTSTCSNAAPPLRSDSTRGGGAPRSEPPRQPRARGRSGAALGTRGDRLPPLRARRGAGGGSGAAGRRWRHRPTGRAGTARAPHARCRRPGLPRRGRAGSSRRAGPRLPSGRSRRRARGGARSGAGSGSGSRGQSPPPAASPAPARRGEARAGGRGVRAGSAGREQPRSPAGSAAGRSGALRGRTAISLARTRALWHGQSERLSPRTGGRPAPGPVVGCSPPAALAQRGHRQSPLFQPWCSPVARRGRTRGVLPVTLASEPSPA